VLASRLSLIFSLVHRGQYPPLLAQLKPGGRLVAPIGPRKGPQFLTLIVKGRDGAITRTPVLPVRFTPLQDGERI
jgi:protein-L-isoaspartate(D-aspartate) O-methyltransferase